LKPIDLIIPYFKENIGKIGIGLCCLVCVDLLQLLIPRAVKYAVDALASGAAGRAELAGCAALVALAAGVIGVLRYVWRRCLLGASRLVEKGLRNQLFAHVQTLSAPYFDHTRTGDLMAHVTNDVQQVRMAVGMGLVAFNDAVVMGAAAIGFMVWIDWQLTLMALLPMPCIAIGTRMLSRRMHRRYQQVQQSISELTEGVRERLAGIRMVKAYGREAAESEALAQMSRQCMHQNLRLIRILGLFFPMMMLFANISLAIVLFWGGRQTILGQISAGDLIAFISYLGLLTWPMMAMGWVTNLIQRGRASLERLLRILMLTPSVTDRAGARSPARLTAAIDFHAVDFSYPQPPADKSSTPALRGIDFHLPAGTMLGIVGPPGSGKSSLLHLIPRLYDVSAGAICLDGIDLRDLTLAGLRSQIAFVPQEPFLFADTVRQNITLGRDVTDKQLRQAVAMAAFDEAVGAMPRGYETFIGEKGVVLSGGQKQRLALARAFLSTAPLLVCDDPISQVDVATGKHILDSIFSLRGRKTLVLVSHRLHAVRAAETILVLADGRPAGQGTHDQLMAGRDYYADTFRLQELEAPAHAR